MYYVTTIHYEIFLTIQIMLVTTCVSCSYYTFVLLIVGFK